MNTERFIPVRHNGTITVLDRHNRKLIEPAYAAPDWQYAEEMAATLNDAVARRAQAA